MLQSCAVRVAASPTAAASLSASQSLVVAQTGDEGRNFKAGSRPPITRD